MTSPNISGFSLTKGMKRLIALGASALVVIIAAASFYGTVNTTNSEGVAKTAALSAQYKDNQNELSNYILKFNESLGIADRQSERLNEILEDAVKGRYDNDSSLEPGTGGSMFSAIAEAYPDLTATTESYAQVQELVVAGRDAYKNKQTKLLDMIRDFETWQNTGLIKRQVIKMLGFPGETLRVKHSDGSFDTGQEALEIMKDIVLVQDARDAYETGTQEPLITPQGDNGEE